MAEPFAAPNVSNAGSLGEDATGTQWVGKPLLAAALILLLPTLLSYVFSASIDSKEPPALKPSVPFIGHIVGLIRHQQSYLSRLSKRRMPVATLPMLNGKMYAIWEPSLVHSALRNKELSFIPFVLEFAQRELNYDDASDRIVKESGLMDEFFPAVHTGMNTKSTNLMNAAALRYIAKQIGSIGPNEDVVIPNVYLWARDLMTQATCEALYGAENPLKKQPSLLDDLWAFEGDLDRLMLKLLPTVTAGKAYHARARLQSALGEFYANRFDTNDDAAGIVRTRAAVLRKFGIDGALLGVFEIALLHVATANTIPTLFWFMANIITRPDLADRLRTEAEAMIQRGDGDEVVVNIDIVADKCPLMVSCSKESIRLSNRAIGNRRVVADTTISDGKGRSYLLKEGVNVQFPGDTLHHLEEAWGGDAFEFVPERFLDAGKTSSENTKAKRAAYVPFGGGKHLCPGRNFAFAENLGFMVSLLLSFDISPVDGDWQAYNMPSMAECAMSAAVCKPVNAGEGFGMRIKRREGWQATTWTFTSGGQ